jgi:hypothetical protein
MSCLYGALAHVKDRSIGEPAPLVAYEEPNRATGWFNSDATGSTRRHIKAAARRYAPESTQNGRHALGMESAASQTG